MNRSSAGGEAERRLAELQAVLDAREPDPGALASAGERVAAAIGRLTRATPPAELARIADLHACVRDAAARRRSEAALAIDRTQSDRARLARLTRPSDDSASLDVSA